MREIHQKKSLLLPPLFWAVWVSLLGGCSTPSSEGGGNSGNAGGGGATGYALAGQWEGLYKSKDQAEPGTTGLRETKALVRIEPTGDLVGQFKLDLPGFNAANVTGTYRDFASKSLLIDISASNFSTLGLTGQKTDIPYQLVGDTLELANDRFAIKLTRTKNDPSPQANTPSSSTAEPQGPLIGRWVCQEPVTGYLWQVHIKTPTTASIDIFDASATRASVWMDGNVVIQNLSANLTITASDVPSSIGKSLTLTGQADGTATLTQKDEQAQAMSCTKRI